MNETTITTTDNNRSLIFYPAKSNRFRKVNDWSDTLSRAIRIEYVQLFD